MKERNSYQKGSQDCSSGLCCRWQWRQMMPLIEKVLLSHPIGSLTFLPSFMTIQQTQRSRGLDGLYPQHISFLDFNHTFKQLYGNGCLAAIWLHNPSLLETLEYLNFKHSHIHAWFLPLNSFTYVSELLIIKELNTFIDSWKNQWRMNHWIIVVLQELKN